MPDAHWVPDYVGGAPLENVNEYISACFPQSGLIHRAMHYLVETAYTDPLHFLGTTIAAVAQLMAERGWGMSARGTQPGIQMLLVGPSAAAKSAAIREVHRLVRETQELYWGPRFDEDEHVRWLGAEGTVAGLLEGLHDRYVEGWEAPTPGVHYTVETTPVLLYHEEVTSLFSKRDSMFETLLQLFDPIEKVERHLQKYRTMKSAGQKPPNVVRRPAISTVFATTPTALRTVFRAEHLDGGLARRLVWLYGRGDASRIRVDVPDPSSLRRAAVEDWVVGLRWHDQRLLKLGRFGTSRVVELSTLVNEELGAKVERIQELHAEGEDRMVGVMLHGLNLQKQIAQVYAFSRGDVQVHVDDLDRAGNFVLAAQESFEQVTRQLVETDGWDQQERLYRAIKERKRAGLARTEAYKVLRCSKQELQTVLDALVDRGLITKESWSGRKPARGRPREVWYAVSAVATPHLKVVDGSRKGGVAADQETGTDPE